jgi:hypothetical protein
MYAHTKEEIMNTGSIRASVVAVMVLALAFAGCGGGGDDQAQGTSTIQGNVTSFGTDVVAGVLPLITVSVQGTDLITTVAADGSFIITGVLAGDFVLVFSAGDTVATYPISVTLNVTITLQNVAISSDGIVVIGNRADDQNEPPPTDDNSWIVGTWVGTSSGVEPTVGPAVLEFRADGTVLESGGFGTGQYSVSGSTVTGNFTEPGITTSFTGQRDGNTISGTFNSTDGDHGVFSVTKQ